MKNANEIDLILNAKNPILYIGKIDPEILIRSFNIDKIDHLLLSEPLIIIDHIRSIIHFLSSGPLNSKYKLVVVSDIDKMTTEAGNSLLKTLEEPPPFAKIVLSTQEPEKVLKTIQSRCEKIKGKILAEFTKSESYLSPDELSKMNYANRFKWVGEIIDNEEDVQNIIHLWQSDFRKKLISGSDVVSICKKLSDANDLLKRNISVKLLLENIVIEF